MSRNRIADLRLRGSTSPLPVRVYWPAQVASQPVPLLVFCIVGAGAGSAAEAACQRLSQDAGVVVLSVFCLAGSQDATNALEWAAEHATELGADPGRLLIAGEGAGGVVAAAVASHARAAGWPAVTLAADDLFEAVHRLLSAGSDEFPGPASSDLRISQLRGMIMHDAAALSGLDEGALDRSADRSRWMASVVLCTGMLMIVLDVTIVNVALPSIQADLGFSQTGLAWVVNAYLIAFGGLLLLAGRLGDLAGRRNVFLAGLAVFTLASMVCGLAQTQGMLVGARFVQGIGGALTSAVILGVIVTLFPEPREMAKAIGVYAFVASAGGAVGLLAGGILTQAINWHWIFFVNLPIGIATTMLALRLVPRDRGTGLGQGADVPGALLITGAMMLGVFTIVKPASEDGWLAGRTLAFGGVAVALLAGFIVRQLTARNPLMPLRILGARKIAAANLIQVLSVAGMFGMFFLGALYLRLILGYSPLQIGLAFLPVAVVMGTLSVRYTDRLTARFGARSTLIAGLALIAAALLLFTQAPVHGGYAMHVLPVVLLMGAGAGLAFPALMTVAMAGATPADAGLASGLVNTTAQVGGALGLAVLATVSAGRTSALAARGEGTAAALTGGYHLAFWIAAGLVAAAVAVAGTMLRPGD